MKRIAIILLFYIGFMTVLHAQEDAIIDSVVNNIAKQLLVFPQEKIYLQTDKPYYITGEKIFFRAFLIDAFSNRQDTLSRYVYVELINSMDSVVNRVKIRKDSVNLFYGAILLPEDLPQGVYKIRAYTRYMQNQGESAFFSKQVRISDPQILSIQLQTDFQFSKDGTINASLRFVDAKTQEVIKPALVTLRLNQDPIFTRKSDNDGWIHIRLNVLPNASARVLYVELTNDRSIFKQYISIPYPEGDFDVSFYPEGGQLIAGQSSNVAFKAVDTHGSALDIKGEIIDSKGNTVAEFKTVHDGMGEFFIKPLPNEQYHAVVQVKNIPLWRGQGEENIRKFNLPEVQTNALALKAMIRDNKLWVSISKPDSVSLPELYLLIHSRGNVVYAQAWDPVKNQIIFDASIFPSGVNHIILLTKDLQIVSERLVFILNDDNGIATFRTQQGSYGKREQVLSEIQLKDADQQPIAGNFSIAVTNDKEVVPDTTLSILSSILLSSELRGQIDNPEYYFQKGNKEAEQAADLLMKTHGWTRYAMPDVIQGKLSYPKIPFEQSQEISGNVKSGVILKSAKNFKVSLLSLNQSFYDLTGTDKNGRFVFRNFEFPDSTTYVIQALNKRGGGSEITDLYVNEDTFPEVHVTWIYPIVKEDKGEPVLINYVAKADLQYTYENGKRMVNLPEVEVKGVYKDKEQDKYKSPIYTEPDYSISSKAIEKYGTTDIITLLYQAPGVTVNKNSIRIRGASEPPLIVIDNIPYNFFIASSSGSTTDDKEDEWTADILHSININDIGRIDVLKDLAKVALYGSMAINRFGSRGVILIYTKRGESIPFSSNNTKPAIPLGYQLPIEFYSPKYDTQEKIDDSKPDLRTTLYWKPNVITDKAGNTKLDFYTADDPGTYSVIIEGVSDEGELIHYQGRSVIKVE